jgi:predicted DNA-binding protein YlxM (UPF0122 family)
MSEQKYLSLKEYQNIAAKLLSASFPRVAGHIMQDNEKFGEVVSALMMADWNFDGRGSLYGYRKQRVHWTIMGLIKDKPNLSLNFNITDSLELVDTLPDKEQYDSVEYNDRKDFLRDKITNSKVLTEKEKTCISQYLTEDVELAKIADDLDIHKEAVKMSIRRGLSKLGLHNEYIERFERRQKRRGKSKDSIGTDGISMSMERGQEEA